jgi:glycine dehydrogenase subunit 1
VSSFLPHTERDVATMLAAIGASSIDELFAHVPERLRTAAAVGLPPGLSEPEVRARFAAFGAANGAPSPDRVFLGAGAYPHYVPSVVDHVLQRSEFATAYTPYQAEVSQGTLQAIFEFQTFAAGLLGLDVANASMYDGASATAEAVLMARRLRPDRSVVLLSRALHPHYRDVVRTYLGALSDIEVREVPWAADGRMDLDHLAASVGEDTVCVVLGYPNVFGCVEEVATVAGIVRPAGGLTITATTEALALAALRSPGGSGVDVAVAEGQSLGLPMSYGGPGLGLFATRDAYVRAMPGRLVGETTDTRGARGYVLTLATREQHIRRERATSNICTNQGLCSLAVTVYLSLLGRRGLQDLARTNRSRAATVRATFAAHGLRPVFPSPSFNEFVVDAPAIVGNWEGWIERFGVVPGFPVGRWFPELADALLVCATEIHDAAAIGRLDSALDATVRRS